MVAVVGAGDDGVHDGLHRFEVLGRGEIKSQQMCPDVREQRRDGFRHDFVMARRGTDAGGHGGAQPVQFGHDLLQQFRGRKGLNGQTGDGIDFRDFFLGPRISSSFLPPAFDGFGQHWVNGGRGGGGGVEPRRQHVAVPARVHVLALALLC